MNGVDQEARNEAERGLVLQILLAGYMEWVPFHELWAEVKERSGREMPPQQLMFHLSYLAGKQYVEMRPLRAGRSEIELRTARATSRAVDLFEGRLVDDSICWGSAAHNDTSC